jgi:hypothetical protein
VPISISYLLKIARVRVSNIVFIEKRLYLVASKALEIKRKALELASNFLNLSKNILESLLNTLAIEVK